MSTRPFVRWMIPGKLAALSLVGCSTATVTNAVSDGNSGGASGAAGAMARGGASSTQSSSAGGLAVVGGGAGVGGLVAVGGAGAGGLAVVGGGAGATNTSTAGAANGGSASGSGGAGGVGVGGAAVGGSVGGGSVGGSAAGGSSAVTAGGSPGGTGAGGSLATTGGVAGAGAAGGFGAAGTGSTGAGGALMCATDNDCAVLNPEMYSCMAVCRAARCSVVVDDMNVQSKIAGSNAPVTGVWDATNRPYVVTAPWKQSGQNATIAIQQLRANGTANGTVATYTLPADVEQPMLMTAVRRDNGLGLLFSTKSTSEPLLLTQFAEMTLGAVGAAPATLMKSTVQTNMPETVYGLGLAAVGTTDWILIQFSGTPAAWRGDVTSFANAPTDLTPLQPTLPRLQDADAVFALVGTTAMVTGWSCTTFNTGSCAPRLQVVRHSTTDLSLMGNAITVSAMAYDSSVAGARKFSPAIGALGGRLVMFWNENGNAGLLLGRTLISETGAYVKIPETALTSLVPKAVAAAPSGGGILFAERLATATGDTEFVAQKFDATLAFVGAAVVLSSANAASPDRAEARASGDGRLLVTYQHGGPRFSLLHAELCQ